MSRLSKLDDAYDLVVIGGGITGAGVLREAVKTGSKVLLVDARDYASGTSSWSSKLVHGGLRYLKSGQWNLTLESVRERQRLMQEAPGLVDELGFYLPVYKDSKPGRAILTIGLKLYDAMAKNATSKWLSVDEILARCPHLNADGLQGALYYIDAQTDDVRLTLRLIFESIERGASALNYCAAKPVSTGGTIDTVELIDQINGDRRTIRSNMVVNASGVWAGEVSDTSPKLRPLRGSHVIFPHWRMPLTQAVSWLHPKDRRPVFAYPWEGAVVYGTTDLDHGGDLWDPKMTTGEVSYLFDALQAQFPKLALTPTDVISSYSGVRPIVDDGAADPSAASRESALWAQPGMVSITGGKLTTFRVTARKVLFAASKQFPQLAPSADLTVFESVGDERLQGRYGQQSTIIPKQVVLGSTPYSLEELAYCAVHEQVHYLDDLLLRRTRLGLVSSDGGARYFPKIERVCKSLLGWNDARCSEEFERYRALIKSRHSLPDDMQ